MRLWWQRVWEWWLKKFASASIMKFKAFLDELWRIQESRIVFFLIFWGMSQLNMHSQKAWVPAVWPDVEQLGNGGLPLRQVFRKRFNFLWNRDVSTALTAMEGHQTPFFCDSKARSYVEPYWLLQGKMLKRFLASNFKFKSESWR